LTIIGAVFGAVGTCGQRCTSTRRLIIHESIYDTVKNRLAEAYHQLQIGNPLNPEKNHVGPLIDSDAVKMYSQAIEEAKASGCSIVVEGGVLQGGEFESGCYVRPCIIEANAQYDVVKRETFAPILYLLKYNTLDEAIALQNEVPQGLVVCHNDHQPSRSRIVPVSRRLGLRHCQCQHRHSRAQR
jgi:aldehyde dehydrogenase (NAD+)